MMWEHQPEEQHEFNIFISSENGNCCSTNKHFAYTNIFGQAYSL